MAFSTHRIPVRLICTVCAFLAVTACALAVTGTPYTIKSRGSSIIVWQRFGQWLMITEDQTSGRVCYYYDPATWSQLNLKDALAGSWMPLGSAIKWLMYVDYYQGLDRLMAHDVDWHNYYIAWPSPQRQVGCAMTDIRCIFGQYRDRMVGDHYPVDLYNFNVQIGGATPICVSDSEKSQFAHDGNLIVYRAYSSPSNVSIYGIYFGGGSEFEIAARNGIEPSVCGSLVAWAETSSPGYNIVAKNLDTGEIRTVAHTTANPPCPEAGRGSVFWQDSRNSTITGIDIYGYDWETGQEFCVTNAGGNQTRLRVCDDLVTWVTGTNPYQNLWGAKILPLIKVNDLTPSNVTADSVQLGWTSPGVTSNPPVSYDLRMRTDGPITDSNWSSSTQVAGLPTPKAPGQKETFTVSPLSAGIRHFAIKAQLQNGDYSVLSNSVCVYVSDETSALANADEGAYISFTGVVTGISDSNVFYCQRGNRTRAIRCTPAAGQSAVSVGQYLTVTGKLAQDTAYYGPVLQQSTSISLTSIGPIESLGMPIRSMGGRDPRFGGGSTYGLPNHWMLVKGWGTVSGLTTGSGCSFYMNDGSRIADNGGQGVFVTSRFPAPSGLQNGSFVTVEGICRVSRTSGRQIETVESGKITVW